MRSAFWQEMDQVHEVEVLEETPKTAVLRRRDKWVQEYRKTIKARVGFIYRDTLVVRYSLHDTREAAVAAALAYVDGSEAALRADYGTLYSALENLALARERLTADAAAVISTDVG